MIKSYCSELYCYVINDKYISFLLLGCCRGSEEARPRRACVRSRGRAVNRTVPTRSSRGSLGGCVPGSRALAGPRASPLPGGEGSALVGLGHLQEGKECWDLTVEVTGSSSTQRSSECAGSGIGFQTPSSSAPSSHHPRVQGPLQAPAPPSPTSFFSFRLRGQELGGLGVGW